jgi:predicted nucleotidyltransferase
MTTVVRTKDEVVTRVRASEPILRAFGVRKLSLFGSFARDTADASSDVDVLIEFAPGRKTFDNFVRIAFVLEDLLQRRVELVTNEALSPHLGPHILREVEVVLAGS